MTFAHSLFRKWFPLVLCLLLFSACAKKSPPLLPETEAKLAAAQQQRLEGEKLIDKGEALIDEGENLLDKADDLEDTGKAKIKEGKEYREQGKEIVDRAKKLEKSAKMLEDAERLRLRGQELHQEVK